MNEEAAEESKLHNVFITDGLASWEADEWLQAIQSDKDDLIENWGVSEGAVSRNDVWKEAHECEPYTEDELFWRSETRGAGMLCAWNVNGTTRLLGLPTSSDIVFTMEYLLTAYP